MTTGYEIPTDIFDKKRSDTPYFDNGIPCHHRSRRSHQNHRKDKSQILLFPPAISQFHGDCTSRIVSADSNLSRKAIVLASTNRLISADENSALHPLTSIHRKTYLPIPTVSEAFLFAHSKQNKCPSPQFVIRLAGNSSKQQPLPLILKRLGGIPF